MTPGASVGVGGQGCLLFSQEQTFVLAGGAVQRAHGPIPQGPARPGGGGGEGRRGRVAGQQDASQDPRHRVKGDDPCRLVRVEVFPDRWLTR